LRWPGSGPPILSGATSCLCATFAGDKRLHKRRASPGKGRADGCGSGRRSAQLVVKRGGLPRGQAAFGEKRAKFLVDCRRPFGPSSEKLRHEIFSIGKEAQKPLGWEENAPKSAAVSMNRWDAPDGRWRMQNQPAAASSSTPWCQPARARLQRTGANNKRTDKFIVGTQEEASKMFFEVKQRKLASQEF